MKYFCMLFIGAVLATCSPAYAEERDLAVGDIFPLRAWCKSNATNDGPHQDWQLVKYAIIDDDQKLYREIMTSKEFMCIDIVFYKAASFWTTVLGFHEQFMSENNTCHQSISVRTRDGTILWSWHTCAKR